MGRRQNPPDAQRRCHEPEIAAIAFGTEPDSPVVPPMPRFDLGDSLDLDEQGILSKLAGLIHEIDPNIPPAAVQPDRTLWEIGYDSLALVALRMGVKRAFGPQIQALYRLRLHSELPRIGCFVRFLAASGAKG
jgi:hypothetical protein